MAALASAAFGPVVFAAPALAQAAPPPPAAPNLGVPTREELEAVRQQAPQEAPKLEIQGGVERSPCPLADPQYADVKVTIGHVTFNNLKGATEAEMEPSWRPFAGKEQPVGVICEIRDAAATILRNKGYLAAVQVPTQRIENGEVKLEALYARVSAIRARGETRGAERKLTEYLSHLTEGEIFDRNKAERYLLLARDLPGYNVQLTLKPAGTGAGDLIGEVTVLRRPYTVDLTVQNYAAKTTGHWGAQLRGQVYGLTGLGDATSVAFYSTADGKEQKILQLGHEFRPGSEGLVIDGQFTYAWTRPDLDVAGPDPLRARTLFASLSARYPLQRTQGQNLWIAGGFDYINQTVRFGVASPRPLLSQDHLRVVWAKADFDAIDLKSRRPRWQVNGELELRHGLDVFDASNRCPGSICTGAGVIPLSRADGDPEATLIRGNAEFDYALGRELAVAIMPRGQYAFDPLLSFEEFTAGNYTVGRGYDPGSILGDSGVGVSAELRGPRIKPLEKLDARFQPYVFGDVAWTWNRNDGTSHSDRLSSVGGGVRADLGDRFRLDATVAVPLEKTDAQVLAGSKRGDPRFLVTLTTRLLPWRT